jgi:hypothetical protein
MPWGQRPPVGRGGGVSASRRLAAHRHGRAIGLVASKTGGKKRLRDSFHAMMSWAENSGRAFRLDELPGLIGKPVGVDEKEIKAIIDSWLR